MSSPTPLRHAISAEPICWTVATWTVMLGIVLVAAPHDWFSATWYHVPFAPHCGTVLGVLCMGLGNSQILALARAASPKALSRLFFASGLLFWIIGISFFAAGIYWHQGLMESFFICYAGVHKIAISASLSARRGSR